MAIGGMRARLAQAKSEIDALEAERRREAEAARADRRASGDTSLYEFIKGAWPILEPNDPFSENWHVGCLSEHLEALTACEILRLIINIPPGHMKSLAVNVFWFAWAWARNPFSRWIFTSYSDSLVNRDAVKCRDIIVSRWFRDRWGDAFRLRDRNAVQKLLNDKQGYRIATTTGGRAGGERANYFIADDPLKMGDASSAPVRQRVNDWWSNTVVSRGSDPASFRQVVVMQRLAPRDLSGYLLEEIGGYESLILPAEYEPRRIWYGVGDGAAKPKDAIVRTKVQERSLTARDPRSEPGEPLWPARYGPAALAALKRELRHNAPGQLQQRPGEEEGAIFRRQTFRYFSMRQTAAGPAFILNQPDGPAVVIPVEACRLLQAWDTASKIKKRNDHTASATGFLTPGGNLLIYHVGQAKIEIPHLMAYVTAFSRGPAVWDAARLVARPVGRWPKRIYRRYCEDASSGTGVLQACKAAGVPMFRLSAAGDKVEKAAALSAMYEAGSVYHHGGAPFVTDFEEELTGFPNAAHDDRTDAAGMLGRVCTYDKAARAGLANLEAVAAEYPDHDDGYAARADESAAKREALAWAKAAVGYGPTPEEVKAAEQAIEDEAKPAPAGFTVRVSGGELDLIED